MPTGEVRVESELENSALSIRLCSVGLVVFNGPVFSNRLVHAR